MTRISFGLLLVAAVASMFGLQPPDGLRYGTLACALDDERPVVTPDLVVSYHDELDLDRLAGECPLLCWGNWQELINPPVSDIAIHTVPQGPRYCFDAEPAATLSSAAELRNFLAPWLDHAALGEWVLAWTIARTDGQPIGIMTIRQEFVPPGALPSARDPWFRPEPRPVVASHYAYVLPAAMGDPRSIAEQIRYVLSHAPREDREELRCYSDLVGELRARYRASASVEELLAFLDQTLPIAGDVWAIGGWLCKAFHVAGVSKLLRLDELALDERYRQLRDLIERRRSQWDPPI